MSNFITFKSFVSSQEAQDVSAILTQNNIENNLVSNVPSVDLTLTGGGASSKRLEIKIKHEEFDAANKILELEADKALAKVSKDHYLFEFTNEELYEILLKKEEWSAFDFELSKKILTERGESISESLLNSLIVQRLDDLAKPEQGQKTWIIIGYVASVFGGLLGVGIGWYLWNFKKTLPNGDRVYASSESDRNQGRNMFILGLVFWAFWTYYYAFTI